MIATSHAATTTARGRSASSPQATTEPRFLRYLLIALALGFLALFLLAPLLVVFSETLSQGFAYYFGALRDPPLRSPRFA